MSRKEYYREYRKNNKEKILALKFAWRKKNRRKLGLKQLEFIKKCPKGSRKDSSWDKVNKIHTCCGSKRSEFHRIKCLINSNDLSDLA